MKVKVCGMRDAAQIQAVEAFGVDMMGFIFYPKSARYVAGRPGYLPRGCKRVGVFVNANEDFVAAKAEEYALDMIQLHGGESPEFIGRIRKLAPGREIIKAIHVSGVSDLAKADDYSNAADYILLETKNDTYGGSGRKFDWSVIDSYASDVPFILSGGISADDADAILHIKHPRLLGIDINSRFENAPGDKNLSLVKSFIEKIRKS